MANNDAASQSASATRPAPRTEVANALRVAFAASLCLVLVEWWNLGFSNLAVWTTHLVMAQYSYTIFQKGVERIIGRGLGILAGLVLTTWFREALLLCVALEAAVVLVCFYVYFANRLAYTFLNAGLFTVVILGIGLSDPKAALPIGKQMFIAILIGVVVADVVTWLTSSERSLSIQVGGSPLWPIRGDWLNHSLMLVVTALLTQFAANWLHLPADKALISVLFLSITPDVQAALHKGELRLVGAFMATAWSLGTFLLLGRLPHFPLLVGLLFLGIFLAAYLTRVGEAYSYAGLQMGLVLPLVLVVPLPEFGSLAGIYQRLEGIVIAVAATVLVGSLWPRFPLRSG